MSDRPAPTHITGTVRWFDPARQGGSLVDDASRPYAITRSRAGVLFPGQRVTFTPQAGSRGDVATAVEPIAPLLTALPDGISAREAAPVIAHTLGETIEATLIHTRRLFTRCGSAAVWAMVEEARQIEASGGMLTADGTRRRTLGGVFFALAKERIGKKPRSTRVAELAPGADVPAPAPLSAPSPSPAPAPITWEDRVALIAPLAAGKASTVKVTIIGRPQDVKEAAQFTVLTLTHTGPMPALPKGIPAPSQIPPTTYAVYIGGKQWRKVADALKNEADMLIIEGMQCYDEATKRIAVFATNTTTKLTQQSKRTAGDGPVRP
jgi:cold shock CspA family protein